MGMMIWSQGQGENKSVGGDAGSFLYHQTACLVLYLYLNVKEEMENRRQE